MSEHVKEVSEADFEAEILKSDLPVVVDFWAPWCGPCMAMAPIMEDIAKQSGGEMEFVKVNIDKNSDLADRYGVKSIPTVIVFYEGKETERGVGVSEAINAIERFIKNQESKS